jgi:hypothetical protein
MAFYRFAPIIGRPEAWAITPEDDYGGDFSPSGPH